MKTHRILIGVGLLLLGTLASAQMVDLKMNVPFDFVVNGATLPSGAYTVQGKGLNRNQLFISNLENGAKTQVLSIDRISTTNGLGEEPKLVFHRYGDTYFLAQVWMAGKTGHEIPRSRGERELASGRSAQNVVLSMH
jgi:hypothetical protein